MPHFSNLTLFLIATIILTVTPGPDTLYVIARSLGQGRTAGIVSVLGICLGLVIHTLAAVVGLSTLLMASAWAYNIVKYAGAIYLIYLGTRMLISRKEISLSGKLQQASLSTIFSQGILSCVLNPKLALFFLAFLPQFVEPNQGGVAWQMASLGILVSLIGIMWLMLVALLTSYVGEWLRTRSSLIRFQQWFTGGMLIALGTHLALSER